MRAGWAEGREITLQSAWQGLALISKSKTIQEVSPAGLK